MSQGGTVEEALKDVREAISLYLEAEPDSECILTEPALTAAVRM